MENSELEHVISDYDLGKLIEAKNLNDGYTNQNIYVNTTAGEYVLRVSHSIKTEDEIAFESDILKKLKQTPAGDFIVDIVESLNGSPFVTRNGHIHTLFRFEKGEDFYKKWNRHIPNRDFIENLGKKCAVLHNSLSNIEPPKTTKDHLEIRLKKNLFDLSSSGLDVKPYYDLVGLTAGDSLVHTDLRIKNLIVNNSNIDAIIDFDDLTYGNQLYDVAWTLKACFSLHKDGQILTPEINIESAKLFLKSYQFNLDGNINVEEIVNLMIVACLRELHFWYFSAPISMTRDRLQEFVSINLAQLDLFSNNDAIANSITP